ncbi:MAG: maleylpyruvate isomerase family mycothiol-dependent enzyme [Hamadaea sp.]|nr:maleylpyruvate isomerase family mycothiol-dependent enzyme [Hamadaea sp.]
METARLLDLLDGDFRRLHALAGGDLGAKVPTCPDWTLADLVEHVSMVYLHKAETMRLGAFPQPWPPEDREPEAPADLLARAYTALTAEFAARSPETPSVTWFEPDQTVGFWIRRMAHESVIHRIDGELTVGAPIAPVPDDLAVDGVDEILRAFLAYQSEVWQEDFADPLAPTKGEHILVRAGDTAWTVTLRPAAVQVSDGDLGQAAATVAGAPQALLLWLWRRAGDQEITVEGDASLAARLGELMRVATQ